LTNLLLAGFVLSARHFNVGLSARHFNSGVGRCERENFLDEGYTAACFSGRLCYNL